MQLTFKHYRVKSRFVGGVPSPLDKDNTDMHNIQIFNNETWDFASFQYWGPRVHSQRDLLKAFKTILVSAMVGALPPAAFCVYMRMNEKSDQAKLAFEHCRDITERLMPEKQVPIITHTMKELITSLEGMGI